VKPSMLKVMTIVGTRPEVIRLSRVIKQLDQYCDHVLIHTGQNYDYELNEVFFSELNIRRPNEFLESAGNTAAETIGRIIIGVDRTLAEHKPDAVLVLGDTNSCLSVIAAKRRMIPIFHMEAGNRCFDSRVPEEINRRIIDHTADIHLTYSEIAREYLLREGLPPEQIIKIGSPMREVINHHMEAIDASDVLSRLGLEERKYFVVSAHREENVDSPENLHRLFDILNTMATTYEEPIVVSTHPRTRKNIEALGLVAHSHVSFHRPFGFIDYVKLQICAHAVLSDSGTITEESSLLNFPALNLREAHERPEGFEEASVMFVGLDRNRTMQALEVLANQPRGAIRLLHMVKDYKPDNVSSKVLRILLSYTSYVNRRVWYRN
jgi:UDP-N-acetylglucosamine 2-epimerase